MWVTKHLIFPGKIRILAKKRQKLGPKLAFLFILGQALPAHLVGWLLVSRKTPIYFIIRSIIKMMMASGRRKNVTQLFDCLLDWKAEREEP